MSYTQGPMRYVACSGFPVPVSRYWEEFPSVEIAETELGIPGAGTVGRWLRESPDGYGFSLLAPKVVAESGFAVTPENQAFIRGILTLAKKVNAKAVVFVGHPEWKSNRQHKVALKAFIESLPARSAVPLVIDLPFWPTDEVRAVAQGHAVHVAFDPLVDAELPKQKLAYMRLMGPAGHRSRYDDPSLERLALCVLETAAPQAFCTFRNIDMYANGKRLLQLLKSRALSTSSRALA